MNRYWNLREELYRVFHNWPAILASILIGCLFGLILSNIWPAQHRATSLIYLALNPYRRYEDTMFEALSNPKYSNLDNYQYWQMQQLEAASTLESFLKPTLERLRAKDPYWNSIDIDALRSMLRSEWRTTGNWSLMANHPDAEYARQAAEIWSDVVVKNVSEAVESSRKAFMIDQQLQADENELLKANMRLQDLTSTIQELKGWQQTLQQVDNNQPLDGEKRWLLLATAASPAEYTPGWVEALNNQPTAEALPSAYQEWIDQLIPLMEVEFASVRDHIKTLDQDMVSQAGNFSVESRNSLSFSPNIEVQRKEDLGVRVVRPSSTFILVGGMVGLLIWLLFQLVIISKSGRHQ